MPTQAPDLPQLTLEDIRSRLEELDRVKRLNQRMRDAGEDVSENEARERETRNKLLRLRQAFFPGQV
jgi:hypothetical protein